MFFNIQVKESDLFKLLLSSCKINNPFKNLFDLHTASFYSCDFKCSQGHISCQRVNILIESFNE
jgi:hypothetical protein